jgi:serine/threonine-protein kinase
VLPAGLINIPNRAYWLAPERRGDTLAWFFRQGLWLAIVLTWWVAAVNRILFKAQTPTPPHLDAGLLGLTVGGLLGFTLFFIVRMVIRFRRPTG